MISVFFQPLATPVDSGESLTASYFWVPASADLQGGELLDVGLLLF